MFGILLNPAKNFLNNKISPVANQNMKKFLYFTKLTQIINKKKLPFRFPNYSNLGPFQKFRTNFSKNMDLEKKIFEPKKNQLLTKQRVSPKNNQFIHLASQKQELLKIQSSILCTVSGGQDSIFTFLLLLHTKKIDSLKIIYCQHFWQIKNFFSARLIFQISYLVEVPYTLILPQKLVESENESRDWRKKNFCRVSQLEHILTIITGHTETDNLEKNLNNLFRGTSPAGLSSLNILNASNRVGLFFSTIKFTSYFLSKREKRRTFYQKFLFQNLKNNNRICSLSFPEFEKIDSLVRTVNLNSFQTLQDLGQGSEQELEFYFAENFFQFEKSLIFLKRYIGNTRILMSSSKEKKFSPFLSPKLRFWDQLNLKLLEFEVLLVAKTKVFWESGGRRSTFQFFKPINSFLYLPIFPLKLRKHQRHFSNQRSLSSKIFLTKITFFSESPQQLGSSCIKTNTTRRKGDPPSKRLKNFRFFDGTKLFQKNKINETSSSPQHCQLLPNFGKERDRFFHFGPHRKSSSFCFSNKFVKLQVNLFKPLENISRSSVSKFFNLYNVPLILDVTNFSYIFSRNKIRHQVLPFIRSLINLNVEKLIINFFTILSQQNKEIGKDIQELYFIFKILNLYFVKSTEFVFYPNLTNSITVTSRLNLIRKLLKEKKLANGYVRPRDGFKPKELKNNLSASFGNPNLFSNLESKRNFLVDEWVKNSSLKIKPHSEIQVRSLLQKFFFDYKNVNLSYSQILKLQDLYSRKKKNV